MNLLSTFSVLGKPGEFIDPTRDATPPNRNAIGDCSAHWFTVKGNIVALGNYEQGTRFVDVSDPTQPEAGRLVPRPGPGRGRQPPAIISSDTAAAYWHGSYVYVADYQRGVDVLKFTDPTPGAVQSKTCWNSCADNQTMFEDEFGGAGGSVPATLSLAMGAPASFIGGFTPGVAKDYTASTTANVVSTAGDAALSVADPSATGPGT